MNLLTCFLTASDCYKVGQTIKPRGVMIHSTAANNPTLRRYVQPVADTPGRAELLARLGTNIYGNHWNQTRVYVYTDGTRTVGSRNYGKTLKEVLYEPCVHGFIGKLADGSVTAVQTLPWNWRGWHCGVGTSGRSANDTHISFEICEDGLTDPAYFAQVYQAAVELTAMLCREYGLDPLADGVVICHAEGYKRGIASNHGDVLHWFPLHGKTMNDFRAAVAAELSGKNESEEIENMSKEELKKLIRETVKEVLDEENPVYQDLKDVPEYWRPAAAALLDAGVVNGGTPAKVCATDLNLRRETLKAAIVAVMYHDARESKQ